MKHILLLMVVAIFLCGCGTTQRVSKFAEKDIELGMAKNDFLKAWGVPFCQERNFTSLDGQEEKLYYKEQVYKEQWYVITTVFTFRDSKLISQKIAKEEPMFSVKCKCK